MKKILIASAIMLGLMSGVNAQAVLQQYQPGNRLINGSQLNLMVNAVNNLNGNGTPGAITGTTGVFSGALSATTGTFTGAVSVKSNSADAFDVGPNATTNPTLKIDGSTASAATGLQVKSAAAASGLAVAVISSGTDENLTLNAKGAGTVTINGTATGAITLGRAVNIASHINTGATAPAPTSCGGGTPTVVGSDTAGIVTMGSSATGCVITFATAYTGTPFCVVSWIATPLVSQSYATSNTAITLTQTSASGNKVQYVCHGPNGG